ncbi:TonB-dependent heme receptor A precursor, partial [Haemophilus influenzae]
FCICNLFKFRKRND